MCRHAGIGLCTHAPPSPPLPTQPLYVRTGMLDIGLQVAERSRASALEHGLDHEVLTGREVNARFPGDPIDPKP